MNDKVLFPKSKTTKMVSNEERINKICNRIIDRVVFAKNNIIRSIDREMVLSYWLIGKDIVEEEFKGERAGYGKELLKTLAFRLTEKLGKGYAITNLGYMKQFYLIYPNLIPFISSMSEQIILDNKHIVLSWTHYRLLLKVMRKEARDFYETQAIKNHWSTRELERQIASLLYDRCLKSKNRNDFLRLATEGQEIKTPEDAIKDPIILEFLNIPESHKLKESKLEEALISNLQNFLLELGKGFAFVGRQKRITLDGDHFYVDLVFYHIILKCYIIVELKTNSLTHADLGQMQFYVNYFDQECRTEGDNPTIGLILCTDKNEALVKYTLGDKTKQIFASKYQFHLPTEEELKRELNRELKEIKHELTFK